jgi:hypothetical protein
VDFFRGEKKLMTAAGDDYSVDLVKGRLDETKASKRVCRHGLEIREVLWSGSAGGTRTVIECPTCKAVSRVSAAVVGIGFVILFSAAMVLFAECTGLDIVPVR